MGLYNIKTRLYARKVHKYLSILLVALGVEDAQGPDQVVEQFRVLRAEERSGLYKLLQGYYAALDEVHLKNQDVEDLLVKLLADVADCLGQLDLHGEALFAKEVGGYHHEEVFVLKD